MLEMSDTEYRQSSLLDLVWFVLRVPFARALRQRTVSAWILSVPLAAIYETFAVPLVVGSVLILLVLMVPMLLIVGVMRLPWPWRAPSEVTSTTWGDRGDVVVVHRT